MTRPSSNEEASSAFTSLKSRVNALFPKLIALSANELDALRARSDTQALLVDVREAEEQDVSTIAGALTTTEAEDVLCRISLDACRESTIVVCFCTVGLRSAAYGSDLATRFGLQRVRNYSVLQHLWDGRRLCARLDDGEWRDADVVHMFAKRYARLVPVGVSTVVFTPVTALWRSLGYVPSILRSMVLSLYGFG